jgi:ubiquinone/menaquinone biosynthesis C-methylase UbiE
VGSERVQRRVWDPVYDRLARWYDAVDWFTGGMTHRLRQIALPYLPPAPARLLEIGYGSGRLHDELAAHYALAGLDRAPGMARLTRRRLAASGRVSALCVGDACALPWPARTFDAVYSTFALSAVPDAERAIAEMIRVTRPGGRVIVVDAGEAMDGNRVARFLATLWSAMGDFMRDERPYMAARGLQVAREDAGPWGCVHIVVGTLPA